MTHLAMISIGISAQTLTLKGNVKDTTGEPVIGASIVEKGNTTNGTRKGTCWIKRQQYD